MKLRRFPLLLAIVLLTTGVPALAELYTDWLWFAQVGYEQVFLKSLAARALLTVLSGVVVFALLGGNLLAGAASAAAAAVHDRDAAGAAGDHDRRAQHPAARASAPRR